MRYYGGFKKLKDKGYILSEDGNYYEKRVGRHTGVFINVKTHEIEYAGPKANNLLEELGGFAR